jgi:PAS domain S-box-containing protein
VSGTLNFLPEATFVIDGTGHVVAWNHAIEEMTGIMAVDIVGKGDYEYAIPFYGKRQPVLIDLVSKPDKVIAKRYEHFTRDGEILSSGTTKPGIKGKPVTLMVRAGPLYNRHGKIAGAIESIRDLTER